ncbi:hypothetical protein D9C73_018723 [Collichthys lucidus]|uniref:Uncharacterized protein n=1 Tax=Collichthys lucidus TaxID=240159 RepID=A0A4U5V9R0_COLLU|nr:hypothetical protein D9C73_018723 [Collichthys lucidus]
MSTSLPKSESTTSLLRTSALNRRSGHSNNAPREHRSYRTHHHHHHHPTGAGGSDDAGWTEDCETSARRPLCQPRHADSRNLSDHRVQKSHSPRQASLMEDSYAQEGCEAQDEPASERAQQVHQVQTSSPRLLSSVPPLIPPSVLASRSTLYTPSSSSSYLLCFP